MKTAPLLILIFTATLWFNDAGAHPAGLITKSACGSNQVSNNLKEVCIGNIGAGGIHSAGAPETILTVFLTFSKTDGETREVALAVTYGQNPSGFVLKYVNLEIPTSSAAFQFADLSKYTVLGNDSQITGIEGVSPEGDEFKVTFESPLDASYFRKIQ